MSSIRVLSIPCINRPDLLERMLASIDADLDRVHVIDNSPDGLDFAVPDRLQDVLYHDTPPGNLGFGGSVNHAIRTQPLAPFWLIANADVELAPGDLVRLIAEMSKGGPRWVGINDWSVFGLTFDAVEQVGYFDESFHPCYLEDCDYEYRCTILGVPWYTIPGDTSHVGSAAIRSDERYRRLNAKTYAANVAYYRQKWGGYQRGGEVFRTPFNRGGHPSEWALPKPSRLRDLSWG